MPERRKDAPAPSARWARPSVIGPVLACPNGFAVGTMAFYTFYPRPGRSSWKSGSRYCRTVCASTANCVLKGLKISGACRTPFGLAVEARIYTEKTTG